MDSHSAPGFDPSLNQRVWFCKTDFADDLLTHIRSESVTPKDAVLIIHNGDVLPSASHLAVFTERFMRVFAVNVVPEVRSRVGAENLVALPIGIENAHWGRSDALRPFVRASPFGNWSERAIDVIASFNVYTNPRARQTLRDAISERGLPWLDPATDYRTYCQFLSTSRFTLSPPGNGPDCHRTWEALYCGSIPVILRGSLDERLVETLPILLVDDWAEFLDLSEEERILAGLELLAGADLSCLDLSFWARTIRPEGYFRV